MAEVREETGEGTLYDTNDVELASTVAYRIVPEPTVGDDETTWGGELYFAHRDEVVPPGLYVLALEDGTRVDVDISPRGAEGDPRRVAFRGVGTFGQRIV